MPGDHFTHLDLHLAPRHRFPVIPLRPIPIKASLKPRVHGKGDGQDQQHGQHMPAKRNAPVQRQEHARQQKQRIAAQIGKCFRDRHQ